MAKSKKKAKKTKMKKIKKAKKAKVAKLAKKARAKKAKSAKLKLKPKPGKPVKTSERSEKTKAEKIKEAIAERVAQAKVIQEGQEPMARVLPQQIIKGGPEEVQDIPITAIMRKGVIVIDSKKTASDGARMMMRNRIGSLVVVEKGKAIGIITERDLVRKLLARDRHGTIAITEIMSTPIRVIEEDKAVKDTVVLMKRYGIKRLPVMDKKKRLIGIVTDMDITRSLPGMMDLLIELSKISRFEAGIESVGVCNRCGMWSENLANVQGEFLCDECKQEEEEENEE